MRYLNSGNPVNRNAPLNRGLKVWLLGLPFWHHGGRYWRDLCRTSNGTLTNMDPATDWVCERSRPGGFGLALDFDGSDDYVNIDFSKWNGSAEATIAFWCKLAAGGPAGSPQTGIFYAGGTPSVNTHYPWVDGNLYIAIFDTTRRINGVSDTGFVKTNWHHFCLTTKSGANNYRLIRNGGASIISGTGPSSITTGSGGGFGLSEGTDNFQGLADDIRFYNRALTDSEVFGLYRASLGRYQNELNWIQRRRFISVAAAGGGGGFLAPRPKVISQAVGNAMSI